MEEEEKEGLVLRDLGEMIYYTVQTTGGFVESVALEGSYSVRPQLYTSVITQKKEQAEDLCDYLNRRGKEVARVRTVKIKIIE